MKSFSVSSLDNSVLSLQLDETPEIAKDSAEDLKIQFNWESEEDARHEIRDTVGEVLKKQHEHTTKESEEIIKSGAWTEDDVAAAFIDTDLKYPWIERIREWLEEDETLERRVKSTVNAVEKLHLESDEK
ncbi:MAG: hypothetical protein ACI977_000167 [Candidatus Nanohaloarchaea archaeon]